MNSVLAILQSIGFRIYCTFFVMIGLACWIAASLTAYSLWMEAYFILIGIVLWQFTEYRLHKTFLHPPKGLHGLHLRKLTSYRHMQHHARPRDESVSFVPIGISLGLSLVSIPLSTLIIALPHIILDGIGQLKPKLTHALGTYLYVLAGIWIGYLIYEYIHYRAHTGPIPRHYFMRYLRTYHLIHHHTEKDDVNFGVSSPMIDLCYGTFRPPKINPLRKQAPL